MALGRRLFLGSFTAGVATVALSGESTASADTSITTFPGQVDAQSFYADGQTSQAAYFKTAGSPTDPNPNTVVIVQNATSGNGAALNVVSSNPGTSAMYLTGTETGRGTLKIAHVGYADGSDANAAALSIDLQTAGTAAQGIYLTTSSGSPTKGNLIALRNNANLDDFIVKGTGLIGIGIDRAATPRAQVHIKQRSAQAGLLVEGSILVGDAATVPTSVDSSGGGVLYAQGGALMWRGSNGTVTQIASA